MRQELRTRASKIAGGAFTGVAGLAIVAFWALVAVFIWQALKPFWLIVVDLWELIPPGARGEVGLGLAIAGGILLILFVIAVIVSDTPAGSSGGGTTSSRSASVGVDFDGADIDVSGM
ncbi:hypothetical protein AB0C29_09490 [Actinoplanes sp. NPDC048791]|uniref:hypothetical protein n=1 Tax=Actinoplanes sp. NPDC048791 TaxID=3154623 RepID=UPI0033C636EC